MPLLPARSSFLSFFGPSLGVSALLNDCWPFSLSWQSLVLRGFSVFDRRSVIGDSFLVEDLSPVLSNYQSFCRSFPQAVWCFFFPRSFPALHSFKFCFCLFILQCKCPQTNIFPLSLSQLSESFAVNEFFIHPAAVKFRFFLKRLSKNPVMSSFFFPSKSHRAEIPFLIMVVSAVLP